MESNMLQRWSFRLKDKHLHLRVFLIFRRNPGDSGSSCFSSSVQAVLVFKTLINKMVNLD